MKLEFEERQAYGRVRFYPLNPDAQFICNLMDVKSVTIFLLKQMKEHGWEILATRKPLEI